MIESTAFKVMVKWLHLSAAMIWLGAIFTAPLSMAHVWTGERESVRRRLYARHYTGLSQVAWAALGILAVTGIVRTAGHLQNGWGDLFTTDWGRLLLVKVGVIGIMILAGGYARFKLAPLLVQGRKFQPRSQKELLPEESVLQRLRMTSLVNAGLGLVVLWIVTLL